MKDTRDIFGRIDELMKKSGKMEKDLITYLGLAQGTYSQWRIGNGHSYLSYIKEICAFFHVTPNDLYLGENGIEHDKDGDFYTKDEINVLHKYRALGLKEQGYIRGILDLLTE